MRPWAIGARAYNPLRSNFEHKKLLLRLKSVVTLKKKQKNLFSYDFTKTLSQFYALYSPGAGAENPVGSV